MRISEVTAATGVSVPTLKFYLREGVLHAGVSRSRTQADYDDSHVDRVRLVRALVEVGGLDLATVRRVFEVIDRPDVARLGVLAAAQQALLGGGPALGDDEGPGQVEPGRARRWLERRGWRVSGEDPAVAPLERAWRACEDAGIGLDEERMDAYADAVEGVARVDVASVPDEPQAAVRQVVVGTVLVDAVLSALRLLAQQHTAVVTDRSR
ncbi:transcriptional regulator [Serinicoccus sp. CUA-874]|uniref:MerR family transcriptional regulator n=1 Tax=Serinicoccus sp. CUA-874 TaxID=1517939 RepID=UPI000969CA0C|nr:MerR family transcriptional regulator [Serinicoccus sp. CUA-874]OLT15572.1 transcriptional regulator [Serinicoccus sp. CUA-874]